jgi:16S rRNA (uracil1498-N3)-methyltransferase
MRRPRLYADATLSSGLELELDPRAHRHATQVLRLRPGDRLVLFDGRGAEFAAELIEADRRRSRARLGEALPTLSESPLRVTLIQAVAKGERMDYSLQKATELGVSAIRPAFTARGVAAPTGVRLENRVRHWQGVIVSACEQCGRSRLPELLAPIALADWLGSGADPLTGFVLDPAAPRGLDTAAAAPGDASLYLLVGPEGGLSEEEIASAERRGLTRIRLGPRVLRTETAAAAALAVVQSCWGDLGARGPT